MTHPETNEFYIGRRTSNLPPNDDSYRGSSKTWYRQLSKDIIDNILIKEIIDLYKTPEELAEAESRIIEETIKNPLCKNAFIPSKRFFTSGPLCDETKSKISKSLESTKEYRSNSRKGIIFSDEHKQKLKDARKNQVFSDEHKRKISESLKGKPLTDEHKNKISESAKGKIFTDEHKQKLKDARKNQVFSEETRQKLRDARKNRVFSEETKKKISESKKGKKYKKKNDDNIENKTK
jgi:hypothetical protein